MYTALTYTYLLLPLSVLLFRAKWKFPQVYLVGVYGLIAFLFLFFDIADLPVKYRKFYMFSYTQIEYLFFTILLTLSIQGKKAKATIIFLSISFFLFQGIYFMTAKLGKMDSIPVGIETILLFMYIFVFFYETFKNPKVTYIYNHHCFWIAVGILLYLGGAFFFYILANHMDQKEIDKYWDLTYIAEILKNMFFIIAVIIYNPNLKNNPIKSNSSVPYLDMP